MSTVLSLPEELVIEILLKADYRVLLACRRVCRTFNVIIRDSLALQYMISLAACGMLDGLSAILCLGTAERLQRLREHEAAWREVAWLDGGVLTHTAACRLPAAISGSVLAFQKHGSDSGDPELGDRLCILRIPSKLRGIPGESWELKGLGEMSDICIDAAQDLLIFHRAGNFHVRTLSSGEVHPTVLHFGVFDMGMRISDVAEQPVVCCDHLAAVVHEGVLSQIRITKGTVIVWSWITGNRVAVLRPPFARLSRDIAFLDERHILMAPALWTDSAFDPGQIYEAMLFIYGFETSTIASVNQEQVVAYCFHVARILPMSSAIFYDVRINANTASFSPPTNLNSSSSPRGYFYADPKDRIITVEVLHNSWMEEMELTAELYIPVRTFLAYMAAHPPPDVDGMAARAGASGGSRPVVDVPWEDWGPCGAHLVRTSDQAYVIRRPRTCGMRVLGAPLSTKSVVVTDYHPGRVARSAAAAAAAANVSVAMDGGAAARARVQAPAAALARLPAATSLLPSERTARATAMTPPVGIRRRCFPPVVRVSKEVPLPLELQKASESPWTMLCEDALLAFEYVPEGFDISRVFAYTF